MKVFDQKTDPDAKARVDQIENMVYGTLKPLGFRKFGRTLHRFVDADISQVIHFQNGCPQKGICLVLWVNLGIRVPECAERSFLPVQQKRYYQEYECNIRVRLGEVSEGSDRAYDLREDTEAIAGDILKKLKQDVLPVFEKAANRDGILANRDLLSGFDHMNYRSLAELEEAMICGRRGDLEQAKSLFESYCLQQKKAAANTGHMAYLKKLAESLGMPWAE